MNYTRAAEELNITQPAVSQHIAHLERDYGVPLFAYRNRSCSLPTRARCCAMRCPRWRTTSACCATGCAARPRARAWSCRWA
ncbi:MAG: LysR family transcriptional regulator [Eggerthellaceae bacterium]